MQRRAVGMIKRVSSLGDIVFTSDAAKNPCMVAYLAEKLDRKVLIPETSQAVGALGVALLGCRYELILFTMKIFVSSKVKSCIADLEKTDKAGKTLAQKASNIIDSLVSDNAWNHKYTKESYTKYGEKRIKHCRKYDLGCGYRLITVFRCKETNLSLQFCLNG